MKTLTFGCLTHCKEGSYSLVIDDKKYAFELKDISTKEAGYSYFTVYYNGHKIGNHQCQGNDCEKTIRKKLRKWLKGKL